MLGLGQHVATLRKASSMSGFEIEVRYPVSQDILWTNLLDHRLQASHGNDGNPYGHQGAQEVTELKYIVIHDTENNNAWLVTGMIEL